MLRAVVAAPDAFRVMYLQPHGEDRVERGRAHWEDRMAQLVAARTPAPAREARLLGRLIVAAAEIGLTTLLDEPESWQPDELAAHLTRTLAHGFSADLPG
jgi:hypothetical protein